MDAGKAERPAVAPLPECRQLKARSISPLDGDINLTIAEGAAFERIGEKGHFENGGTTHHRLRGLGGVQVGGKQEGHGQRKR